MKRIFALAVALLLSACSRAPTVASGSPEPASGKPARIALDALIAQHPFARVLAQYEIDIATLASTERAAPFANMHYRLNANAADIARDVSHAVARVNETQNAYAMHPLPHSSEHGIDAGDGALARFNDALQVRIARAHAYRAQQFEEKESMLALNFERAHLKQRLRLELRLRNRLYIDPRIRHELNAQMAALDSQERAIVESQRSRDAVELQAYDAQLVVSAKTQTGALAHDLAMHDRAVDALPPPFTGGLPADFARPRDRSKETAEAFRAGGDDLTARFGELRSMDDGTRAQAQREVAALAQERDALRDQIVASIESRAATVAREKGFGRVYDFDAPTGATDITAAVAEAMKTH